MGPRNPTETEGCTGERLIAFRKGRAVHDTCVSGRGKATGVGNILNHANTHAYATHLAKSHDLALNKVSIEYSLSQELSG